MRVVLSLFILTLSFNVFAGNKAGQLTEFKQLGIPHLIYKNTHPRLEKLAHPEDRYFLDVQFGRLSQGKFLALKKFFSNRSQVPYNPTRNYDLTDFLDPAIQAVVNHVYLTKSYSFQFEDNELDNDESGLLFALSKNGIESFQNCWGTTMQVLRHRSAGRNDNSYYFYWPDRWGANDVIKDPALSEVIAETDIEPGDVLTFSSQSGLGEILQHTAIVLTQQLVFEKTDSSENDPYRISLRSDVVKKYQRVFAEDGLTIEYRRYKFGDELFPQPKIPTEVFDENIMAKILRTAPTLKVNQVVGGCETGMGGGCDPMHNEIETAEVRLNKKTGHGVISGNKQLLQRLIPLN